MPAMLGGVHASRVKNRFELTSRTETGMAKKIAQFRTHYLTKESAYVSTQQSG